MAEVDAVVRADRDRAARRRGGVQPSGPAITSTGWRLRREDACGDDAVRAGGLVDREQAARPVDHCVWPRGPCGAVDAGRTGARSTGSPCATRLARLGRDLDPLQIAQALRRSEHVLGGELFEPVRLRQAERANLRPPEIAKVRATAEQFAEIGGERPDVGAGGAVDLDAEAPPALRRPRSREALDAQPDVEPGLSPHPDARGSWSLVPPTLIAETIGGTCSMEPVRCLAAALVRPRS